MLILKRKKGWDTLKWSVIALIFFVLSLVGLWILIDQFLSFGKIQKFIIFALYYIVALGVPVALLGFEKANIFRVAANHSRESIKTAITELQRLVLEDERLEAKLEEEAKERYIKALTKVKEKEKIKELRKKGNV